VLLDAILAVLGKAARPPSEAASLVTRHSLGERRRPLRILLAEDNDVNRRLLSTILEKQGHAITVATNGREAVSALGTAMFDLVLMDVQMPEMDGFEATARIRAAEKDTGHHVPIVALTAHALKGDREACLAAGMDDYLSKPVRAVELLEVIDRLSGNAKEAPLVSTPPVLPGLPFDPTEVLRRMEGDRDLLRELVELFAAQAPRSIAEIHRCLEARDAGGLERAAHLIRGSALNFGMSPAAEAAFMLERLGRSGVLNGAATSLSELERGLERLLDDLRGMLAP
jgi:CheY-like chemotaxis protein/HPt (histidine-containing phosphotransfer) domain-containing protein